MTTHRKWTDSQVAELRRRYADEKTEVIANAIGRPVQSCYTKAAALGLKKSEAFFASPESGRTTGERGLSSRFTKGHQSWNKGNKGYDAGGRSHKTRFKAGGRPANWVPIGTEVTDRDGYLKRKIRDDAPVGQSRLNWEFVHVLTWEAANGPRPPGHSVIFKDGIKTNITIDNLDCIPRRQLMKRNTIHNYPKPLADVMRQKGTLTREINKQRRAHEEQH